MVVAPERAAHARARARLAGDLLCQHAHGGDEAVPRQHRRAQLEHQPPGAVGRLLERRPGHRDRRLEAGRARPLSDERDPIHRHQRRDHHLDRVVVELRRDPAALDLFSLEHAGDDLAAQPLALAQRAGRAARLAAAAGDVAADLGDADHPAGAVVHVDARQPHLDPAAVLAPSHNLGARRAAAPHEGAHELAEALPSRRRLEEAYRLPHRLLFAVPVAGARRRRSSCG